MLRAPTTKKTLTTTAAVALALAVAGCGDLEETDGTEGANGVQSSSGNTENPPPDDVEVTGCDVDAAGWVRASGTIVNHSSKPSTYFIQVEFVAGGTRFAEGIASSSTVAPDQTVEWEASGVTEPRDGFECKVISVERTAS